MFLSEYYWRWLFIKVIVVFVWRELTSRLATLSFPKLFCEIHNRITWLVNLSRVVRWKKTLSENSQNLRKNSMECLKLFCIGTTAQALHFSLDDHGQQWDLYWPRLLEWRIVISSCNCCFYLNTIVLNKFVFLLYVWYFHRKKSISVRSEFKQ